MIYQRKTERRIALLSTAFGFGPVSKAVTIARALSRADPQLRLEYFGQTLDNEFALSSGIFDVVHNFATDDVGSAFTLTQQLRSFDAVVSVLNFLPAEHWRNELPPLFLVDSLTWLWKKPQRGIERCRKYFIQGYISGEAELTSSVNTTQLVGPIVDEVMHTQAPSVETAYNVLLSLGGCSNPFVAPDYYERYAVSLVSVTANAAEQKNAQLTVATNGALARVLRERVKSKALVATDFFAPTSFRKLQSEASLVVMSPGITATLEARMDQSDIRFLLPHNFSQALMAERYKKLVGSRYVIALSDFGSSFGPGSNLSEEVGVRLVGESINSILGGDLLLERVEGIFDENSPFPWNALEDLQDQSLVELGQHAIAREVLLEISASNYCAS